MPRFAVAASSSEFVGYASDRYHLHLDSLLGKLASESASITCQSASDGTIASLSAAGLGDTPDVWVRIVTNTLILGREAFGKMTLYWWQNQESVWFASKLQILLPLIATPEVSIPGLYGYSCFSYVPTPLTPVRQIWAVSAGTELIWEFRDDSKLLQPKSRSIWQWQPSSEQIVAEKEAIAQLQTLLVNAIQRQIADLPDVPVGVSLSGGLDSAIVAALLVQHGVKVRAYSLDFGSDGVSEYSYAQQVAQWLDIPLIKVEVTAQKVKSVLSAAIKALDVPFGDGATLPLFLLNSLASQEVGVIFNGEGGDQLFAGWTNKPLIAASVYQDAPLDLTDAYLSTFHRLWGYEAQVWQPNMYQEIKNIDPVKWIESALDATNSNSLLHRLRRANLMLKGAQNIQPRATNLALGCGLKVRSPFNDLDLAQWTFSVAGELCLQGACEKYILKKAVESWLPPEIVWRNKRGMGVPLTSWCWHQWWRSLGMWLNPGILESEGRWQPDLASKIAFGRFSGQIQGRRIGEILWLLIIWQLWRVEVLQEPIGKASVNHPFWLPYRFWQYWG